jgi:hypothetical protein
MSTPNSVTTGAIALIKVSGRAVGLAKNVRISEQYSRQPVQGLGTILLSELAVTSFSGTLSCDYYLIDFQNDAFPESIDRNFNNVASQALTGGTSFEDQLTLSTLGFDFSVYKRVQDLIDPVTGVITPKVAPICTARNCFIESDSLDISEGSISGRSQSFRYLTPITYSK